MFVCACSPSASKSVVALFRGSHVQCRGGEVGCPSKRASRLPLWSGAHLRPTAREAGDSTVSWWPRVARRIQLKFNRRAFDCIEFQKAQPSRTMGGVFGKNTESVQTRWVIISAVVPGRTLETHRTGRGSIVFTGVCGTPKHAGQGLEALWLRLRCPENARRQDREACWHSVPRVNVPLER